MGCAQQPRPTESNQANGGYRISESSVSGSVFDDGVMRQTNISTSKPITQTKTDPPIASVEYYAKLRYNR